MAYRKEAAIRVGYFSVVTLLAILGATIITVVIVKFFPVAATTMRRRQVVYSFGVSFVGIGSLLVYWADRQLNKRFNKNPL